MYVYTFQSDPRVVFSVADVLACHRETRITLALSSLLQTLAYHQQTHDRRFSIDGSVLFSFVAALACHQQTRQFSADGCAVFSVGGVHRSSRVYVRVRCLVLSLKPTSLCNLSSLSNAVVITERIGCIQRIRIDTCADDGMPAYRPGTP